MLHNINEIKEKIQEIMLTTPNITNVGYGYKISNGKQTDELAIVYSVKEKKNLSELSPEEVIPPTIKLSSGNIKTDVSVMTNVEALACNANCGQNAGPASAANRAYTRPLKGGLSITSQNLLGYVGTMGFIGVHTDTQTLVGVTNNHVVIQDAFYTSQRNLSGLVQNEYSPVDNVYQSGEWGNPPYNPTNPPASAYEIGRVLRYVPINQQGFGVNYVDCAIFSLLSNDISNSESFKQIGELYNYPLPFATTEEIDDLLNTNPMIYSSGRTTGPKGGSSCPMRVDQLGTSVILSYTKQNVPTMAQFVDVIRFVKPENDPDVSTVCSNPVIPGDSGSALIADFDGTRKIIGLVFAAGYDNGTSFWGYACRIDRVAQELGIEAWDGSSKYFVDPSTIEYKTTINGSSNKTLTCGDKTYWQVGLTTDNEPC